MRRGGGFEQMVGEIHRKTRLFTCKMGDCDVKWGYIKLKIGVVPSILEKSLRNTGSETLKKAREINVYRYLSKLNRQQEQDDYSCEVP